MNNIQPLLLLLLLRIRLLFPCLLSDIPAVRLIPARRGRLQ